MLTLFSQVPNKFLKRWPMKKKHRLVSWRKRESTVYIKSMIKMLSLNEIVEEEVLHCSTICVEPSRRKKKRGVWTSEMSKWNEHFPCGRCEVPHHGKQTGWGTTRITRSLQSYQHYYVHCFSTLTHIIPML